MCMTSCTLTRTFCTVTDWYLFVPGQNYVHALGRSQPGKVGDPSALSVDDTCQIILTGAHKCDTSFLLNLFKPLNHLEFSTARMITVTVSSP